MSIIIVIIVSIIIVVIIIIIIVVVNVVKLIIRRMMGPGVGVVVCLACLGWPGGGQAQVIMMMIVR